MTGIKGGGRAKDSGRGQVLAEFALVIPLFLAVFIGIAEGGYFVAATTIVSHATQEGARYGVLHSTPTVDAVQTRVRDRAAPVVSILKAGVEVCVVGKAKPCDESKYQARAIGDRLEVTTTYQHRPLVGYVFPGLTFQANARTELLVEGDPTP